MSPTGASDNVPQRPANIVLEHAKGYSTLSGQAKIVLKVTNNGDLEGNKTYTCYVYLPSETSSQSVTVELDGGETKTVTVDVEISILNYGQNWTWDVSPRE